MVISIRKIIWILKYRVIFILVIIIFLGSILIKGYFSESVQEHIKYDCMNKIQEIITKTLNQDVVTTLESDSLMKVTYNDENEVVYAYIDTKKTNEILALTSNAIIELTNEFNNTSEKTIEVPIGYILSENVFLGSNFKIPISISSISTYNVKLKTDVEEYGINSSLVTVNLVYEFSFKAIIPLITNDVVVTNEVPLLTTVLYGDVPNYFFEGVTPNLSIQ